MRRGTGVDVEHHETDLVCYSSFDGKPVESHASNHWCKSSVDLLDQPCWDWIKAAVFRWGILEPKRHFFNSHWIERDEWVMYETVRNVGRWSTHLMYII